MSQDKTLDEMTLDAAIEKLGALISKAGGEAYDALEVVKEASSALDQISRCTNARSARILANDALKGWMSA